MQTHTHIHTRKKSILVVICLISLLGCYGGQMYTAYASETSDSSLMATSEDIPVYRLYNKITSEHLFTSNKTEYDNWAEKYYTGQDYWEPEGIAWTCAGSSDSTVSNKAYVYRLYNAALGAMGHSSHYYTSNVAEKNRLIKNNGWVEDLNKGFFSGGTVGVYTCYNEALGSAHHYTTDNAEYTGLAKHQWNLEKAKNNNGSGVFTVKSAGILCGRKADKNDSFDGQNTQHSWITSETKFKCTKCGVISSRKYIVGTTKITYGPILITDTTAKTKPDSETEVSVTITGVSRGHGEYDGKRYLVVDVKMKNLSSEKNWMSAGLYIDAFQNGVSLDDTFFSIIGREDSYGTTVKPGVEITGWVAFELNDNSAPVELESSYDWYWLSNPQTIDITRL